MPDPTISDASITTPTGTVVTLARHPRRVILLDHPDAPTDLRNVEVGRVIGGGFQTPSANYAMSPATLRAIADLVEQHGGGPA